MRKEIDTSQSIKSPRGSKDPNNRVLGPKYYSYSGIWALKPYYLSPWTHREFWVWGYYIRCGMDPDGLHKKAVRTLFTNYLGTWTRTFRLWDLCEVTPYTAVSF